MSTREFLPENGIANDRDLEDARRNIRKILEPMVKAFPKSKHPMHAVGTSKTIRSLARLAGAVVRQPGRVDTSIMTIDQLEDWLPPSCGHLTGPAYRIAGRHAGAHVSDRRWRLGDRRDHEGA